MDLAAPNPAAAAEQARLSARCSLDALARDDVATALREAERALSLQPDCAAASHALGIAALRLGRLGDAISLFELAHRESPRTREHAEILAIAYAAAGRLVDSLYYGKLATALTPSAEFDGLLPAWLGTFADRFLAIEEAPLLARGRALLAAGRARPAAEQFRQEIALDRNSAPAWCGLGEASLALGRPADAIVAFQALCALAPDDAGNLSALGQALTAAGRHDEAMDCHREACGLSPEPGYRARLISACVADPMTGRSMVAAEIAAWTGRHRRAPGAGGPVRQRGGERALRIGFLSGRLHEGAGLDLFLPLIEARDRTDWQAVLYLDGRRDDPLERRLRNAATAVTEIGEVDDETALLMIGNDELDILIDLDLHEPGWRGIIPTRRPAAAVLGWLGLGETSEALGYDAMLGDRWTQGCDDRRSVVVAGGIFAMPGDFTVLSRRAGRGAGALFTTLATPAQITGETVALWARLLASIPQGMFRLAAARLGGPAMAGQIRERFVAHGVGDRVAIDDGGDPMGLGDADVVLDPPGAAAAPDTALAALRAGLPMVTLPGAVPARRQIASLLGAIGLDAMIAADEEDYLAIAGGFAAPAARDAAAGLIAERLDRPAALMPAARAVAFGAALRRVLETRERR